jgi:hypothetical protein
MILHENLIFNPGDFNNVNGFRTFFQLELTVATSSDGNALVESRGYFQSYEHPCEGGKKVEDQCRSCAQQNYISHCFLILECN